MRIKRSSFGAHVILGRMVAKKVQQRVLSTTPEFAPISYNASAPARSGLSPAYTPPGTIQDRLTQENRLGLSTSLRGGLLSDARIQAHHDAKATGPRTSNAMLRILNGG